MGEVDLGIRCDQHVGEVFPPRCAACDAAAESVRIPESFRTESVRPVPVPRDTAWPIPADEPDEWSADE